MNYELGDSSAKDMPTSAIVVELMQIVPVHADAALSHRAWPESHDYRVRYARLDARYNELGDELDRRVPGGGCAG